MIFQLLSACINAASLAVMNAGCSIRFPVAAVTVIATEDENLIIDPSASQIEQVSKRAFLKQNLMSIFIVFIFIFRVMKEK